MSKKVKILFSLVGVYSLIKIIDSYGTGVIVSEIKAPGFPLVFLALTFIPTLIFYSISWLLATDHQMMKGQMSLLKKIFLFCKFTVISIAWNNLTPFLKVGGEPLKYLMLTHYIPKKNAIKSTINYNIIHLLATLLSFIIGSLILIFCYDIPPLIKNSAWLFVLFFCVLLLVSYKLMKMKFKFLVKFYKWRTLKIIVVNTKIVSKRLESFIKQHPRTFILSLFSDTFARFIEGLTFYFSFSLIKHPIGPLTASFLDVARTLIDTMFFFIPYQVGSREEGVKFFMEKVLLINPQGFLTVVLFYRFVEIVWIIIGYILWISVSKSSTEVKV